MAETDSSLPTMSTFQRMEAYKSGEGQGGTIKGKIQNVAYTTSSHISLAIT